MKRPFALFCAFCALLTPARALSTGAASAVLMEQRSGQVLYAQDPHARRSIASVTKLMTALVAAERMDDLDQIVRVDPAAVGVEGSSIYLNYGEELTLRELLYGLMLRSGNDAAVAIAIHCAGDVDTFCDWMNATAARLGMADSHFTNPHGLEQEGHYSSAYDLALLAREVLTDPALAQIVATRSIRIGERDLTNHNKLLWRYEGCVGLKTGYTKAAGRTLVSAATRDGTTFIAVTLHDSQDWEDHPVLLDYGFDHYRSQFLARGDKALALLPTRGSLLPAVPVVTACDVYACLPLDAPVTARITLPQRLTAPVENGQEVGFLSFWSQGEEIAQTALLAALPADLARPGWGLLQKTFSPKDIPTWRGPLSIPAALF